MERRAGAVEERAVRLELNGRTLATWTASPGQAEALGAGRLLTDGHVASAAQLLRLEVEDTPELITIRARTAASLRDDAGQAATATSPAGAEGDAAGPAPAARAVLPPLDAFPALFRELFACADRYADTGGLHSAALSDGRALRFQVEEVGRHNAVDKVIGLALLAGDQRAQLGLVISARISGEMARKAAQAGLAWIASRSVPTTLAVAEAERAGMPIVARAASKEPRVFGAP